MSSFPPKCGSARPVEDLGGQAPMADPSSNLSITALTPPGFHKHTRGLYPVFPGSLCFLFKYLYFIIIFCLYVYFPYQNLSFLIAGTILYHFNNLGAQGIIGV